MVDDCFTSDDKDSKLHDILLAFAVAAMALPCLVLWFAETVVSIMTGGKRHETAEDEEKSDGKTSEEA